MANWSISLPHVKADPELNDSSDEDDFDDFELAQIDAQIARRATSRRNDIPDIAEPPDPPSAPHDKGGAKRTTIPDIDGVTDSDIDEQEINEFMILK